MLSLLFVALTLQNQPSVTLTVTGLPQGLTPPVTITGPHGTSTVTDYASFTSTLPGQYKVSGPAFRAPGKVVDTVYIATEASFTVKEGEPIALTLKYTPRGGTGMIWFSTARIDEETDDFTVGEVRAYRGDALDGSSGQPSRKFAYGPRLYEGVIDPAGNFLFGDGWDIEAIMKVTPSGLGSSGSATKLIEGTTHCLAIDPQGNLWVEKEGSAVMYKGPDFKTPSVTIKPSGDFTYTNFIFNTKGDLVNTVSGVIHTVRAADLKSSGSPTPVETTFTSGTVWQAAFDEEGNLWVAAEHGEVRMFTADEYASGGSTEGSRFEVPQSASGLAIDNENTVWVLIRYTGDLYKKTKDGSSFVKAGNLGKGLSEWSRLNFNPAPEWSPLSQAPGSPKRLKTD